MTYRPLPVRAVTKTPASMSGPPLAIFLVQMTTRVFSSGLKYPGNFREDLTIEKYTEARLYTTSGCPGAASTKLPQGLLPTAPAEAERAFFVARVGRAAFDAISIMSEKLRLRSRSTAISRAFIVVCRRRD